MVPALGENPYELVEIFRKSVAILNSPSADSTWMDEVADLSNTQKYFFQTESLYEPWSGYYIKIKIGPMANSMKNLFDQGLEPRHTEEWALWLIQPNVGISHWTLLSIHSNLI